MARVCYCNISCCTNNSHFQTTIRHLLLLLVLLTTILPSTYIHIYISLAIFRFLHRYITLICALFITRLLVRCGYRVYNGVHMYMFVFVWICLYRLQNILELVFALIASEISGNVQKYLVFGCQKKKKRTRKQQQQQQATVTEKASHSEHKMRNHIST